MMADAFLATHEQHRHRTDRCHGRGIVPCAARQQARAVLNFGNGGAHLFR